MLWIYKKMAISTFHVILTTLILTYFTLLYCVLPTGLRGWRERERHTSLFSASLLQSLRLRPVHSLILSVHWARGLSCIFPSRMFFIIDGCRLVWPKYLSFLSLIVFNRDLFKLSLASTAWLDVLSFQLILPMRLKNHISQASSLSMRVFVNVQVSQP